MEEENQQTTDEGIEQQYEQDNQLAYEIGADVDPAQQIVADAAEQMQQIQQEYPGDDQEYPTYDENYNTEQPFDQNAAVGADADVFSAAQIQIAENQRDYSGDENFQKLTQFGIHNLVAGELVEMFEAGIMKYEDLEERTLELIKSLQADHGCFLLNQFRNANLLGIQNTSAYLGSLIKNFKERLKRLGPEVAVSTPLLYGPPKEKIQEIMERTGYSLEVTIGQRKYGGPPPGYEGPVPGGGCEVYIGKIPKDVYEDDLIPLFEKTGQLYDLRLMMDPITGTNKGYAFATYMKREDATEAAKKYEGYAIRPGKHLRVNVSVANTRLFVGNIPKSKSRENILEEFSNTADVEGMTDVIVYPHPEDPDKKKNRGFCFIEFSDHKSASQAKRRLSSGRIRPWNCDLVVDWAEPLEEPDPDAMSQVKAIYIKNLKESCTEDMLKEEFQQYGEIDKVKKVKDYAFVHFDTRENAMKAVDAMQGKQFQGVPVEVSLAKPQSDSRRRAAINRINRGASRGGGFTPGGGGHRGGMQSGGNYQQYDYSGASGYGGGYGGYGYGNATGGYDYNSYDYSSGGGYAASYGGYGNYDYSGYGASSGGYGYGAPPPPSQGYGGQQMGQRGAGAQRGGRGTRMGGQAGMPRGGGGRGGLVPTPSRGRGGMQQRGRGGGRGMRGGGFQGAQRGGSRGGLPVKRKLPPGGVESDAKRRNEGNGQGGGYWATAPVAGQPTAGGAATASQDWSQDDF